VGEAVASSRVRFAVAGAVGTVGHYRPGDNWHIRMRVFISWSGTQSRLLAEILRGWMPNVIQAVRPYFTPDDVEKGARWASEVSRELEKSAVGIVCLTRDNLEAPWIMFEAGALSRSVDRSSVCPVLFGVSPADVKGPLLQFQGAPFDKGEMRRVMDMINGKLGEAALEPAVFDEVFEMWWPSLQERVAGVLSGAPEWLRTNVRSERDILEEILSLSRAAVDGLRQEPSIGSRPPTPSHMKYWPPLLRRAVTALFELLATANRIGPRTPAFVQEFDAAVRSLQISGIRDLQASVIDSQPVWLYHDWPSLIGRRALYRGHDGVEMYTEMLRHPYGVVAWADRTSNVKNAGPLEARFNVALYGLCDDRETRVVVEAHEELTGS
jgi:hypothetical protein